MSGFAVIRGGGKNAVVAVTNKTAHLFAQKNLYHGFKACCEAMRPRYLHHIWVLPQFLATGGIVGHLALRPSSHRFDSSFPPPPRF